MHKDRFKAEKNMAAVYVYGDVSTFNTLQYINITFFTG